MSTKSNAYQQKLAIITAIAKQDVRAPQMPMDTFIQESCSLYHWARGDLQVLLNAGLPQALLDDLPVRCDAASEAQSLWQNAMLGREAAQQRWHSESPEAYALRDELLHNMRYAYFGDETLLTRVAAVAEGDSDADMIQDLNDLSVIGRENSEALEKVGFDLSKLELAAEMSSEMNNLKAAAGADKALDQQTKEIRDRAYTHLKEAVDAIRRCGQFVFWKNDARRKGYASAYNRRRAAKSEKAATALQPTN